jgi:hypothetical protein
MYACFISYCHAQHDLMKNFISQLKNTLKSCLEPYMKEEVFIDEERSSSGYHFNENLAEAICESVCMIVIYCPRYEDSEFCLREYDGMKRIQAKRKALLGSRASSEFDMIIPIVLRGDPPKIIKDHIHYCDFSAISLPDLDNLNKNPVFVKEIENIAKVISGHRRSFEKAGKNVFGVCREFRLPPISRVSWRPTGKKAHKEFPGRETRS